MGVCNTVGETCNAHKNGVRRGVGEGAVVIANHTSRPGWGLGEVKYSDRVAFGIGVVGEHISGGNGKALRGLRSIGQGEGSAVG